MGPWVFLLSFGDYHGFRMVGVWWFSHVSSFYVAVFQGSYGFFMVCSRLGWGEDGFERWLYGRISWVLKGQVASVWPLFSIGKQTMITKPLSGGFLTSSLASQ